MKTYQQPFVSVVIAFLNEARFLPEAVKSVLDQDYQHFELLLVDDGSTDSSTQLALDFAAASNGKIIYCEHEGHKNKGLSASRNQGISQAKGELIAFLDADDVWLPGKLTQQVNIFEKNPGIGMAAEASDYWYSWDNKQNKDVKIPVGASEGVYEPPQLMLELYPLSTGAAPCPSALILTKEAIAKAGGFEESFIKEFGMYEDQAFLSKIYLKERVYISEACNNLYRQRPESIVKTVQAAGQYDRVRQHFLEWLERNLQKENVTDTRLLSYLKKSLMQYRKPTQYLLQYTLPVKGINFIKRLIGSRR
ncbi:MAG: glycosyltransferase family 2 protein [Bacteroidota bacterium]